MNTTPKIALALPTNRGVKPKCLQSLLEIVAHNDYNWHVIVSTEGYNTAENRNWITAQAVKAGCTHIFFVDDDMIYAPDTVEKLLSHDKDIVGAKYHVRRDVSEGNPDVIEYFDYEQDKDSKGLFQCKALGGGCILVKIDIFKVVPQPWFGYKWNEYGMVTMSNDWYFAEKVRECNFDIWCDPSLYPAHIGTKEY